MVAVRRRHAVRVSVGGKPVTLMVEESTPVTAVARALAVHGAAHGVTFPRNGFTWVRNQPMCDWCDKAAVLWVGRQPTCEWCDQVATRYDRGSSDDTPLCMGHARNEYPSATDRKASTGVVGVSRYVLVPLAEWKEVRPS